jgi:hypothetical protein
MRKIWERMVPLRQADRSWDVCFWQAQGARVRFRVAFDMLRDFYNVRGMKINGHTFRLQRTVENLKRA